MGEKKKIYLSLDDLNKLYGISPAVGVERWTLAQSQIPHHIWSQINNKFTPKSIKTIRQHIQ